MLHLIEKSGISWDSSLGIPIFILKIYNPNLLVMNCNLYPSNTREVVEPPSTSNRNPSRHRYR